MFPASLTSSQQLFSFACVICLHGLHCNYQQWCFWGKHRPHRDDRSLDAFSTTTLPDVRLSLPGLGEQSVNDIAQHVEIQLPHSVLGDNYFFFPSLMEQIFVNTVYIFHNALVLVKSLANESALKGYYPGSCKY